MVLLSYFETVVRYEKFFNVEPQHIPDVLVRFVTLLFTVYELRLGSINSSVF